MKIIITGVSSFLGRETASQLLAAGHQVYGMVRPGSRNAGRLKELEAAGLQLIRQDMENLPEAGTAGQSFPAADVWIHFAWDGIGSAGRSDAGIQASNLRNTQRAYRLAAALGCGRFLFAGSQAEYGKGTQEAPAPVSEYGKAKLAFGQWAAEQDGPDLIHLRIYSVYGAGDHETSLVQTCIRTFLNGSEMQMGPCTQQWNYMECRDCAAAISQLAETADVQPGIYDIASEDSRPLRAFVEEIHALCGAHGHCSFGVRQNNAEGAADLKPDLRALHALGFRSRIAFTEGICALIAQIQQEGKKMKQQENRNSRPVHSCIACGGELQPLMTLDRMPASAQGIPDTAEAAEQEALSLTLCQCEQCGLVQFDTDPVSYYKDVIRAGGGSTTMHRLRHEEYSRLLEAMRAEGISGRSIVEVGCGRGEFLKMWQDLETEGENTARFALSGIEHSQALVEQAQQEGLSVSRGFAEAGFRFPGAPFDAFVQFNFLEHQPHPAEMLRCIYENLKEDGMGLLTVPSLEYILKHDGYYELIRDHIAYYTEETLGELMERCGFRVLQSRMVNRDTIEVIVKKKPEAVRLDLSSLLRNFEELDADIHAHLKELQAAGKSMAIWGASHQGFTLASTTALGGQMKYIIDSAPFKQGRFAPGSSIPIVAPDHFPEDPVDEILIVAPGYTDEIAEVIRTRFGEKVRILVLKSRKIQVYGEEQA